jgi:hypothetical protein
MPTPFPQSYWVLPGLLCAGHYPGDLDPRAAEHKLSGLLACGIRRVVSLIPADERGANGQSFVPYAPMLQSLAAQQGVTVECLRHGFADASVPDAAAMRALLDLLDQLIAAQQPVYVHCWGGHGRTSTVVGCYLVRHGAAPQAAIDQIMAWRRELPKNHYPFERDQEAYVRAWATVEKAV